MRESGAPASAGPDRLSAKAPSPAPAAPPVPPVDLAAAIGAAAAAALRAEALAAPKPGLVDAEHRGAHRDMDCALLLASAAALEPGFAACAAAALAYDSAEPSGLLAELRPIGRAAEAAMYRATGGVNTHKGAVFCLGLLAAAAALVIAAKPAAESAAAPPAEAADRVKLPLGDRARLLAARIVRGIVGAELAPPPGPAADKDGPAARPSAGERLYRESGVRGARGQAEDGYPLLGTRLLPLLRAARSRGQSDESARIDALLASMTELEDSCLLSRGGVPGLELARRGAAGALAAGGAGTPAGLDAIRRLDAELCARNLSPGGSADMLAAAIFLLDLEDRHPEA